MSSTEEKKMARKIPGVKRLANGGYFVRVTARCPRTKVKVHRKKTLPPMPIEDVLLVRATMAKKLKEELERGRQQQAQARRQATVADYAEQWLKQRTKRLRASVGNIYLQILADRILPVIGEKFVAEITRAHVEEWVIWAERQRNMHGRAYAQDTLRSWWRVLGTLLRDAAAEYGIPDPTSRVSPPRSRVRNVREKRTLTVDQLTKLLDAAKHHFPEWHAEIFVLAMSGMRPGELYALRWEDLDYDGGCIHIRRAVWKQNVGPTKTDAPRDVAMPAAIAAVLKEHRQQLLRSQHPGLDSGLVFPSLKGTHRYSSTLSKTLGLVAEIAELPLRVGPQVLRRTFNTLLLETGVNQIVLRSQMGHTTQAMTQRYAGVHIERKQEAVQTLLRLTQADAR